MLYERFKEIFLTFGICEVEFSFKENNRKIIRIENYSLGKKSRSIMVNDKKIGFIDCRDLFRVKILDDCDLECLWDDIQIEIIDGMIEEDYEKWYSSIEHLVLNYFYDYQIEKSISNEEFIRKLKEDEYNGNLLLLAGTNELNDISSNYFRIIIQVPEIHRFYVIENRSGDIVINVLISFIEEIKKHIREYERYSNGRLLDNYNDKNAKFKSEKYIQLLKYEKSQNSLFMGRVLMTLVILSFSFILFSIPKIKSSPYLFISAIIVFILLWIFIVLFGKTKKKKEKEFEDKYFKNINPNEYLSKQMNQVILEKYNSGFEHYLNRIKNEIPKIKVYGPAFEDNVIDFQLEKNSKGLYFNFYPDMVIIMDENDNSKYFRYDRYSYEELEDVLVELVKKHFN